MLAYCFAIYKYVKRWGLLTQYAIELQRYIALFSLLLFPFRCFIFFFYSYSISFFFLTCSLVAKNNLMENEVSWRHLNPLKLNPNESLYKHEKKQKKNYAIFFDCFIFKFWMRKKQKGRKSCANRWGLITFISTAIELVVLKLCISI